MMDRGSPERLAGIGILSISIHKTSIQLCVPFSKGRIVTALRMPLPACTG